MESILPRGSRQLFLSGGDPFERDSPAQVHHSPQHALLSLIPFQPIHAGDQLLLHQQGFIICINWHKEYRL